MAGRAAMLLSLLLLAGLACAPEPPQEPSPRSGRERVLHALEPPTVQPLGHTGILSTLASSLDLSARALVRGTAYVMRGFELAESHRKEPFSFTASDGTELAGYLFRYQRWRDPSSKPLMIMSFGLMQDREGTEAAKVHRLYLGDGDDNFEGHVLILDHPTAGSFLARNGSLSVGSYDDARLWLEIAAHLKQTLQPSGIHAVGVSMSGQTVVHALLEDRRRGLGLFDSGLALSIAPDFGEAPGGQFASLPTRDGAPNPWRPAQDGGASGILGEGLWLLIQNLWLPSYDRHARAPFTLEKEDAATFFRVSFRRRLDDLRAPRPASWNADFALRDLDAYMQSTRIAGVIGEVRTPLVLLNAADDPAVGRWMFQEVACAAVGNPSVVAYESPKGGHFAFDVAYGKEYVLKVSELLLDPRILASWDGPEGAEASTSQPGCPPPESS